MLQTHTLLIWWLASDNRFGNSSICSSPPSWCPFELQDLDAHRLAFVLAGRRGDRAITGLAGTDELGQTIPVLAVELLAGLFTFSMFISSHYFFEYLKNKVPIWNHYIILTYYLCGKLMTAWKQYCCHNRQMSPLKIVNTRLQCILNDRVFIN